MAAALPTHSGVAPDMVSVAVHELRTPLTVVVAMAQIVERDLQRRMLRGAPAADEWKHEQQVLLTRMRELCRATNRLKVLGEDLLTLRRTGIGVRVAADLRTLTRTLLNDYQVLTSQHILRLRADAGPCMVWAEPSRIEQVVRNLVDNAIAYSPPGSTVDVYVRAVGDTVELVVRDEGTGIAADQLEAIFLPFYRGPNSTELHVEGSGLGLYVSASIVKAHQGRIWAESTPPLGSTFVVQMPRHELQQFASAFGPSEQHAKLECV